MTKRIILASSSPRRRLLLQQIGIDFEVIPAKYDEVVDPEESPSRVVEFLALKKAEEIAWQHPDALVIGSDTVVVCRGKIMGKPADHAEARTMLRLLSGITHKVYTGVALIVSGADPSGSDSTEHVGNHIACHTFHECTDVTFGELKEDEITAYIKTGSPLDKAGAYGIQDDLGALFVEKINGDYYNVVGFPLFRFYKEVNKLAPGAVTPFE